MPALNFQERFAEAVEKGWKRQTIRRERKRPIKRGDRLTFYTGMRTKECRPLGEVVCTMVFSVRIDYETPLLNEMGMNREDAEVLARADGFASWAHMSTWFEKQYGLPFEGVCIQW